MLFVAHPCPTLCNPMDSSPPGSYVHGILQAIILEWVAIPFSRGSSCLRDQTQAFCIAADSLPNHQGTPHIEMVTVITTAAGAPINTGSKSWSPRAAGAQAVRLEKRRRR